MRKLIREKLKNKQGVISIFTILWLAVLIPFLLFVTIDLSQYIYDYVHLKNVTDNAAASAVTMVDNTLIPQGILQIDSTEATATAENVIASSLDLQPNLSPYLNSTLRAAPTIQVYVENITSTSGVVVSTPAGDVTVFHPSVIVYADYPVKGLVFSNVHLNLKKIGISQAQFSNVSL